jgi:FkbM family methyltransferase
VKQVGPIRFWIDNLPRVSEISACSQETSQWFFVALDYLGLRRLPFPYELRLRTGERIVLREHTDVIVFWTVFARRHYPVAAWHHVIVDIGANIGMFTLYAARKAPEARIISIEPFPDTRSHLEEMVKANRLEDRVTVLDCAISSHAGERKMDSAAGIPSQYRRIFAPETRALNMRHRGRAGALQGDKGVPVRTETLGWVLDRPGVNAIDLVKMNIHGSEYDVLLSTDPKILQRCREIAVQYHEMPVEMQLGKQQIFEHLDGLGFGLVADHDTRRGSGLAVLAMRRKVVSVAPAA